MRLGLLAIWLGDRWPLQELFRSGLEWPGKPWAPWQGSFMATMATARVCWWKNFERFFHCELCQTRNPFDIRIIRCIVFVNKTAMLEVLWDEHILRVCVFWLGM